MIMNKQEIRHQMRQFNLGLSPEVRQETSARLFGHIEQLAAFASAHTVALFASLPDEPDTAESLARWSRSKRVVVPRVEGDIMQFYDYDPAAMECGAFGIAEPQASVPCDPSDIDLIVVPGTAFTAAGDRMGRGRGYYDKYLSLEGFHAYKAGVCYRHQVIEELPSEPHDVRMNCLICE